MCFYVVEIFTVCLACLWECKISANMLNILLFMIFLAAVHIEVSCLSLLLLPHRLIDWYIFFPFDAKLVFQSYLSYAGGLAGLAVV